MIREMYKLTIIDHANLIQPTELELTKAGKNKDIPVIRVGSHKFSLNQLKLAIKKLEKAGIYNG